jgi:quercetin dioxygenase-like cupin family protein
MSAMMKEKSNEDLKARAIALAGLVSYQDGAVVSREVVSQPTGTVTAFAFDAGEQLSEHTAPFDAMAIDLDGEADITIGGKVNRVKPGEMIIMPAAVPHALKAVTRFKMLLVMIKKPA